ncbi:hypothetical protein AB1Y20_004298 [Prymnesium parvum]|uniref:BZIP domain-containing protein n=1 Tax=Prymnesium parvum TaxID=97485 RepID=A0AB34IYL6_PRYPA
MTTQAEAARGRPKRCASEPPMPKGWKPEERLAGCLAYLEASEMGSNSNLEADVASRYEAQLKFVSTNVSPFVPSLHRWKAENKTYQYTMEESIKRRPYHKVNAMVDNYKDTRKACINIINPIYIDFYNKDGSPPSGKGREELILKIKNELSQLGGGKGEQEKMSEKDALGELDISPGVVEGDGDQVPLIDNGGVLVDTPRQPAVEKEAVSGDVGPFFLTWLHLGPLGTCNINFMPPTAPGSSKASTSKPPSREELRQRQSSERAKLPMEIEEHKVKQLGKLAKEEKKANKLKKKMLYLEKRKRAEEEFELQITRLEKRMALHKNNKEKLEELTQTYDALLETGVPAVSDLSASSDAESSAEKDNKQEGKVDEHGEPAHTEAD